MPYIDDIIQRSVLSNWGDSRLVIRRTVDRGEPVYACWQPICDVCSQNTTLRRCIQTLEERELLRVGNLSRSQRINFLDHDVRVSFDHALSVQLLWRSKVVRLSINKVARLEILDSHGDSEGLVGGDGAQVGRERKLRRGHEVNTGDDTNGSWVA